MALEDNVEKWHKVATDVKDIPEKPGTKTLHDLLFEESSLYYIKNMDRAKGHMKFKSDEEARKFAGNLWDKAATHVAKTYLKLSDATIDELKKAKDEDGNSVWETHMQNYLGLDRKGFQDRVVNIEELNPRTISELLVNPLYEGHVQYRTSQRVTKDVRTTEDAQSVLGYLKQVKAHNPKTYRGIGVPKKIASVNEAANALLQFAGRMPEGYHPKKAHTYEAGYKAK